MLSPTRASSSSAGPSAKATARMPVNVVEADSVAEVKARLAEDPWGEDMLATRRIEPWTILLRRQG
jgi:hypothetical protein